MFSPKKSNFWEKMPNNFWGFAPRKKFASKEKFVWVFWRHPNLKMGLFLQNMAVQGV